MIHSTFTRLIKLAISTRKNQLFSLVIACLLLCGITANVLALAGQPKHSTALTIAHTKKNPLTDQKNTSPETKPPVLGASTASQTKNSQVSAVVVHSSSTSNASLDFTLSTSSVTVQQGASTPTITASTVNGNGVYWVVAAPPAAQSYMLVKFGITGGSNPQSSDSFAIGTNPIQTQPGSYTGSVTAYYAGHLSSGITKTFTIIVLPQPTFTLSLGTPEGVDLYSNSESCIYFYILWALPPGTTPQPVTGTAYVAGLSPTDKVISVNIANDDNCILVQTGSTPVNGGVIRFVISDSTYSASGSTYYSVL